MTDTTHLSLSVANPAGAALCLRAGDLLLAVNGNAFTGSEDDLTLRVAQAKGGTVALTFDRGGQKITVLSQTAKLGDWEEVPVVGTPYDGVRINPDMLTNWEILRDGQGQFDLQPLRGSILALIAPPVWMLQMRLWVPGSALVAAAMVAAAVSPLMFLAVYLTAGLHLWYSGARYFRKDRIARGLMPFVVLAAPNERMALAAFQKLSPESRFIFAPAPAPAPERIA